MRKGLVIASAGVITALLTLPSQGSSTGAGQPPTTLDETIVAEGERDLGYGPGQDYTTRRLGAKAPNGKVRPLAGFKQLTDVHVLDEESPGRVEYFDYCHQSVSSAYRVQEALSAQVGESMLRRVSKIKTGPALGVDLSFTISTGDNIDNNQLNEARWFVDLLDGEMVVPDSGTIGQYDGFTTEEFDGALSDEILAQAQEGFDATGTKQPWYVVLGNHDGLVQGNLRSNAEFQFVVRGANKVFLDLLEYDGCPEDPTDPAQLYQAFQDAYLEHSRRVPSDGTRAFMGKDFLHDQYFDTTGKPRGHGLNLAPDYPYLAEGQSAFPAGYYAFPISDEIVGVSMDTIAYDLTDSGQIDNEQFRWLEKTLKKYSRSYYNGAGKRKRNASGKDRLIVLFSHHHSTAMRYPSLPEEAPDEMMPIHCFEADDSEGCELGEGLRDLLHRYPNVIAWVNGHGHRNRVTPFSFKGDQTRGFWEINTAAHIDWPQQSRLIEIGYVPGSNGGSDTVVIYGTLVDHGAAADPDLETQDPIEYLASISRVESYYDACVREEQARCDATGEAKDQNVRLVMEAPFDL